MTLVYFRGMNNIGKNFMAYYYFETEGKQMAWSQSSEVFFCQYAIIGSVTLNNHLADGESVAKLHTTQTEFLRSRSW